MKLPSGLKPIFTKSEWNLLGATSEQSKLNALTPAQKKKTLGRLRKLKTKYRDLARRQAMSAQKAKGYRTVQANLRTKKKAQLVSRVCESAL